MVLDPADPDTASAGSFFTNPILRPGELARLEEVVAERDPGLRVPTFPAGDEAGPDGRVVPGSVKVPAAWLIEQAGFGKGYPGTGAARISSKHTLALTNRGGASAAELIGLAREIVAGVRRAVRDRAGARAGAGRADALALQRPATRPAARAWRAPTRCRGQSIAPRLPLTRPPPARCRRGARPPGFPPPGRAPPARRRCRPSSLVLTSSGAAEPRTDIRASPASWSSPSPCTFLASSYCAVSRDPKSSGSSAPSATGHARVEQLQQRHGGRRWPRRRAPRWTPGRPPA